MILEGFTEALTGLERVDCVGWPFRGTIVTSQVLDVDNPPGFRASESYTVGQDNIERAIVGQGMHYPIRQVGAPVGWEYWFMHSRKIQSNVFVGGASIRASGDLIGMWSKNKELQNVNLDRLFLDIGVPLKTATGGVNVTCYATHTAGQLLVGVHSAKGRGGKEFLSLTYPVEPIADIYYAAGETKLSRHGLRTFSELDAMPETQRIYSARTHGFYENKVLLSIGADLYDTTQNTLSGYITPQPIAWRTNAQDRDDRTDYSREDQWQPFLFLELEVNGRTTEDITLRVVHSWADTAGVLNRTEGEECGLETGTCILESSQTNAVLDVSYDDSGNIQTVYGDFIFRSESSRERSNFGPGWDWTNIVDYTLRHRIGADEREIAYSLDFSSIDEPIARLVSHVVTVNEDIIFERITTGAPKIFRDKNHLFSRAPYAGSEIRAITMPIFAYSDIDIVNSVNILDVAPVNTPRSVTGRNGIALYLATDSGTAGDLDQPVGSDMTDKAVSYWSICHSLGFSDLPDFNNDLSGDSLGEDGHEYILLKRMPFGYTGARAMTPANPVTGAIELPPINRPQSWVHYL